MLEDRQDYSFIEKGGLDYTSKERFQYYDLGIKEIIPRPSVPACMDVPMDVRYGGRSSGS